MLILTIIQGPDKGKTFELPDTEPQLLGRSSEALPITDSTVSRRHAELTPDDGRWWLRDLGSQNGTYLNGIRIQDRTILNPGDQIRTGATLFVFGQREGEPENIIRLMRPGQIDTAVERVMPTNDDSVILAEPEPSAAAMHHLQVIYRLTALTSQLTDRQELLAAVMELVFNEFKPDRGFIMLGEGSPERALRPAVVKHRVRPKDKREAQIHVSRTILQAALRKGEGVLSSNAMSDPRFAAGDSVQQFNIRSAICAPIMFRDQTFGAIYVDSSMANYTFTAQQLALMNAIGRHTGLALATAEAYARKLHTERLAAMGETVASLSHSIKNILQGLRGGADVVEMGLKKEDLKVAMGGWNILKRNLERIRRLTLNMLAYSRQQTLEIELTKLGPLLDDCALLLHDLCMNREVALLVDVDQDVPPVPIDPNLMHQAFMNLLGNAVEAVPAKTGAVTVRAEYTPQAPSAQGLRPEVRISVIDNGPGVPREKQERIFEPFHTTKGMRGTGLGLAVTRRIIEEHGGRIEVESEEGRGATFRVILPADSRRLIDPSATAATHR